LKMIITIDGPAASGKSTTAKIVAGRLGMQYLDTGALYRALTLAAMRGGFPATESEELEPFLEAISLEYHYRNGEVEILLGGEDISVEIRKQEVTSQVSAFSALPTLRRQMVLFQRRFAQGRNLIAEGRDMGSVVFPDAPLKVYLVSDPEERARRRLADFKAQGRMVDEKTVLEEILKRDALDSGRETSPLVEPEGAICLDNSRLSIEEQVEQVILAARERWVDSPVAADEILFKFVGESTRPSKSMRPAYFIVWAIIRTLMRLILGARFYHEERSRISGPLLLASNHIAFLDPPAVGSAVNRELSYVAKRELFRFPPFGALIGYFNAIPIRRGAMDRAAFGLIGRRLRREGAVLVFPEGTRKPEGALGRAKFGIGRMAQQNGVPVLPVFIQGTSTCFSALLRRRRVRIAMGRPLHIAPLIERGLTGRPLYERFGEGVMDEIARLQAEMEEH
jgi:CMP/dCMP kinase